MTHDITMSYKIKEVKDGILSFTSFILYHSPEITFQLPSAVLQPHH